MIKQFSVLMSDQAGAEVAKVLDSGYIGQGPKVEEFEKALKQRLNFDYGVTLNSATSALWLALHLLDIGPGDSVFSTPMTCSATNEVITLKGADILWVDVDKYGNIDPESIAKWYPWIWSNKRSPKAIMTVDWGGMPCDYSKLRKFGIPIIEDAAHAYGAEYAGEPISRSGGDFIAFSFQAIKHLTTGDGGLLVVPEIYYSRAKLLRWYGLDRETGLDAMRCKLDITEAGYKFHMNDINATIGLVNMAEAEKGLKANRDNASYYDYRFLGLDIVPERPKNRMSSDWLYTIHVPNPARFEKYMADNGVMVSQVHNRNDDYTCFKQYKIELPNLDKWFSTMCCIPVGWWLSKEEIRQIADLVVEYVK